MTQERGKGNAQTQTDRDLVSALGYAQEALDTIKATTDDKRRLQEAERLHRLASRIVSRAGSLERWRR